MLNEISRNKLDTLLTLVTNDDNGFTVTELEGFLYAIVITPERIPPSEWIPMIVDEEMPECAVTDTLQELVGEIILAYNFYNNLYQTNRLHFPYNIEKIAMENTEYDDVMSWVYGFFTGLQMRYDFWTSGIVAKEMQQDHDPITFILKALEFILYQELEGQELEDKDFYDVMKASMPPEMGSEDIKNHGVAVSILSLPVMVRNLQDFAFEMRSRLGVQQPITSIRIGRNDPCPCGSGKKYKKCCL